MSMDVLWPVVLFVLCIGFVIAARFAAHYGAKGPSQSSEGALCAVCVQRARCRNMTSVYVYRTGHILSYGDVPSISLWPMETGVLTMCDRDIGGMGTSTLYRLDAPTSDDELLAGRREGSE